VWAIEYLRCSVFFRLLTILLHVDLQTLVEATGLALVAAGDVNHATSVLFADVVQVATKHKTNFCSDMRRVLGNRSAHKNRLMETLL